MDNSFLMRRRQSTRDLQCVIDRSPLRQSYATHSRAQRLALQQLSNDVRRTVMRVDVIDNENVRMIQRPGRLCFLLEPGEALFVGGKSSGQNLDRYLAIHLWIVVAIHLAHSALANL